MTTYKEIAEARKRKLFDSFKPVYDYFIKDLLTCLGYGESPIYKNSFGEAYIKSKDAQSQYFFRLSKRPEQDDIDFIQCPIDNGHIEFDSEETFKLHLCENGEDMTMTIKNIDVMVPRLHEIKYSQRTEKGSADIEIFVQDCSDTQEEFLGAAATGVDHNGNRRNIKFYQTSDEKLEKYNKTEISIKKQNALSIAISSNDIYSATRTFRYRSNNGMTVAYEEVSNEGLVPFSLQNGPESFIRYRSINNESGSPIIMPVSALDIDSAECVVITTPRVMTTNLIAINKLERAIPNLSTLLSTISPVFQYIISANSDLSANFPQPKDIHRKAIESLFNNIALPSCDTERESSDRGVITNAAKKYSPPF